MTNKEPCPDCRVSKSFWFELNGVDISRICHTCKGTGKGTGEALSKLEQEAVEIEKEFHSLISRTYAYTQGTGLEHARELLSKLQSLGWKSPEQMKAEGWVQSAKFCHKCGTQILIKVKEGECL